MGLYYGCLRLRGDTEKTLVGIGPLLVVFWSCPDDNRVQLRISPIAKGEPPQNFSDIDVLWGLWLWR